MGAGAGWYVFHRSQFADRRLPKAKPIRLGGSRRLYFNRVSVQAYVTSDVYEKNYGGSQNISGNFRITIPLWNPGGDPTPHRVAIAK